MQSALIPRLAIFLAGLFALAPVSGILAQQQVAPNAVQLDSEEEALRRYSVELIVFEYVGAAAGTTEIFEPETPPAQVIADDAFLDGLPPDSADRPVARSPVGELPVAIDQPTAEARRLDRDEDTPFVPPPSETLEEIPTLERAGVEMIDPADYQLVNAWDKLVQLDAYRPLIHTAWIQPTLEKDQTEPLGLRRLGDPPLRLDGTVMLYLSRFLHLVVDLRLEHRSPTGMAAASDRVRYYGDSRSQASLIFEPEFVAPSIVYRIREDRIVRNNDVRYYDHPKFGVIARVDRIEEETPEDMDTTDDLLPGSPIP